MGQAGNTQRHRQQTDILPEDACQRPPVFHDTQPEKPQREGPQQWQQAEEQQHPQLAADHLPAAHRPGAHEAFRPLRRILVQQTLVQHRHRETKRAAQPKRQFVPAPVRPRIPAQRHEHQASGQQQDDQPPRTRGPEFLAEKMMCQFHGSDFGWKTFTSPL